MAEENSHMQILFAPLCKRSGMGIIMRILLVEDDRQLNESLTFQLEKEGFTVDSCFDGEEACYYGEQNIYDIIR